MIVAMPPRPQPRQIRWEMVRAVQTNRSQVTGRPQRALLSEVGYWRGSFVLPPIKGEEAARAWRAFLLLQRGGFNSFRLPAVEGPQGVAASPFVDGAGGTGTTLLTGGWGAAGTALPAGALLTVGDQLVGLTADVVVVPGGGATIAFEPRLHYPSLNGAPIEADVPTALVRMTEPTGGWDVEPGPFYGVGYSFEEVW